MATAPSIPDSNGVAFLANLNAALLAMGSATTTTAGTAPAFTASVSAITSLATGQSVRLSFNAAGTTGSNTLNVSSTGAKNLMQYNPKGVLVPAIVASGMIADLPPEVSTAPSMETLPFGLCPWGSSHPWMLTAKLESDSVPLLDTTGLHASCLGSPNSPSVLPYSVDSVSV